MINSVKEKHSSFFDSLDTFDVNKKLRVRVIKGMELWSLLKMLTLGG